MMRRWQFLLWLALVWPGHSQTYTRQNIATIFGFENNSLAGVFPPGWIGNTVVGIVTDNQFVHGGKYSARIDRTASSTPSFSTITQSIPIDFAGTTIQWRGWIKMQNVSGYVALWAGEYDAKANNLQFATMQGQGVSGTADWQQYSITMAWAFAAKTLNSGFFLSGAGTAWVDDLELLVDGVPVAQAPNGVITVLDTDHQFDNGSGVALTALTDNQIANLATLAKVWGFVKYHHPAISSGHTISEHSHFGGGSLHGQRLPSICHMGSESDKEVVSHEKTIGTSASSLHFLRSRRVENQLTSRLDRGGAAGLGGRPIGELCYGCDKFNYLVWNLLIPRGFQLRLRGRERCLLAFSSPSAAETMPSMIAVDGSGLAGDEFTRMPMASRSEKTGDRAPMLLPTQMPPTTL